MGAEQAAGTLEIVAREQAARRGQPVDEAALRQQKQEIIDNFEKQSSAYVTSGLLLDDGVIDPRDTRPRLIEALDALRAVGEAARDEYAEAVRVVRDAADREMRWPMRNRPSP